MSRSRRCWHRRRSSSARSPRPPTCTAASVLVRETSEAVLRWANSTMTTNGHSHLRRVTVIALVAVEGGTAAGVVSSSVAVTDPASSATWSGRRGRRPRRRSGARRDAAARADRATTRPGPTPPPRPRSGCSGRSPSGLAEVLRRPAAPVRLRQPRARARPGWAPPPASAGAGCSRPARSSSTSKTPDLAGSAWAGASTADFTDVDVGRARRRRRAAAGLGRAPRHAARRAATRRCCRRRPWPT